MRGGNRGGYKDITGLRFGSLLILERRGNTGPRAAWIVLCERCGRTKKMVTCHIKKHGSCGCLRKEAGHRNKTHGQTGSPTYRVWRSMISRCNRKSGQSYKNYAGRGITVCERWKRFENFFEDMGERPKGKTLDRKDNDKGYYKDNCRWATPKEQSNNTRKKISNYEHDLVLKQNALLRSQILELEKRL